MALRSAHLALATLLLYAAGPGMSHETLKPCFALSSEASAVAMADTCLSLTWRLILCTAGILDTGAGCILAAGLFLLAR